MFLKQKKMIKYSLVIPCYNEAKNIPLLLKKCDFFARYNDIEIIFVNNGSTDDSKAILKNSIRDRNYARIVNISQNRGYGYGILSGLNVAKGTVIGWTHADLQTNPRDIIKAFGFFRLNNTLAYAKGRRFGRKYQDLVFTYCMSFFEMILLRRIMIDINAQPTLFTRDFFVLWKNPPHDFSLDLYSFYLAKILNLKIFRFPVFFGDRLHGTSHWNLNFKAKIKFILRTIRYSIDIKKLIKTLK